MHFVAKSFIPKPLLPLARKIYQWVQPKTNAPNPQFPEETLRSLPALKCKVSYNKYGGYCVPLSSQHRYAARKILANDVHEPDTIEFLIAHSGNGDIVHAGTYFGDFLPALSHACGSKYKVWAFEPNSENFRCAKITSLINALDNVELTNAGLGQEESTAWLRTSDEDGNALGGASSIIHPQRGHSQSHDEAQPVHIITIDNFLSIDRPVGIVQLDVEGYEKEALAGMLKTIRRWRPIIVLEVWPKSDLLQSTWFLSNILSLGYRKIGTVHENCVLMCDIPKVGKES